ncbi:radical SAM protein [bacterium]|nr:radical SAM protein [bacterium]
MRYNRVLLISPPSSSYLGAARPPQNLGFLAQALLDNHIEYEILDMRLGYKWKHLKKKIDEFNPDLIGITLVSLEYLKSYALIDQIKAYKPDAGIIVGGPHVTVLRVEVMQECESIDYGVVREGEATLIELCKGNSEISEIKGIIFRNAKDVVFNGIRELPANLDDLSWPRYEKFEMKKYIKEMAFNSSRGCPYECVFCPNKMMTRKWRFRSATDVVDEIEYWYGKGYRIFNYDDDNFTLDNRRVYDICDDVEKRGIKDIEFRCSNGIRADRTDRALLKRMREVGFNYIAFGVDGGNNRMLKINKKGETIEQIEAGIKNATELGFDVKIFVILAMPQETMEDIEDALRLVAKYPIKRVLLNNPIPYPGTELFDTVRDNGWFIKQPEEYLNFVTENENTPVFDTPEISFDERVVLMKRIRNIEKQVTRRAVQRMYAKYGPFAYIIAALFATDFVEKLFFQFKPFRRIVEFVRFRQLLAKQRRLRVEEIT